MRSVLISFGMAQEVRKIGFQMLELIFSSMRDESDLAKIGSKGW